MIPQSKPPVNITLLLLPPNTKATSDGNRDVLPQPHRLILIIVVAADVPRLTSIGVHNPDLPVPRIASIVDNKLSVRRQKPAPLRYSFLPGQCKIVCAAHRHIGKDRPRAVLLLRQRSAFCAMTAGAFSGILWVDVFNERNRTDSNGNTGMRIE